MNTLNWDMETYSECDIKKAGTYAYAAHPSTAVLMASYSIDGGPVYLWQPHLTLEMPLDLKEALTDPTVVKKAFNAAFERLITKHVLLIETGIKEWRCSQAAALSMGFAAKLDTCLKAIGLTPKDPRGNRLITLFSTPNPKNWKLPRSTWNTHPAEWQEFCEYCVQDTASEMELWAWIEQYPPNLDWENYWLDQQINDTGLPVDLDMARGAIQLMDEEKGRLKRVLVQMTGLFKVTREPMLRWFAKRGVFLPNTQKDTMEKLGRRALPGFVKPVAEAWSEFSSRAADKFKAILASEVDGWIHGAFQFCGASRTGRFAGRIVQVQNLKSTVVESQFIGQLSQLVTDSDAEAIRISWPKHTLSELLGSAVRHCIKAPDGFEIVVSDWSSIESRVLGWLTNCRLIADTFDHGLDTYKVFAAEYYGVPYEEVTKEQRKFAKPPTLGCGYRLGTDGLIAYADGYGVTLTPEESERAVTTFRTMYYEVPQFWYWIEEAVVEVLRTGGVVYGYGLEIGFSGAFFYIQLPSKRKLYYFGPHRQMHETPWGEEKMTLSYMGTHQKTGQWTRIFTHGGKLTENIVQAIAADILLGGLRAVAAQRLVFLHVHDEIGTLVPRGEGEATLQLMRELMSERPWWAPTLNLGAEGWVGERYAKL